MTDQAIFYLVAALSVGGILGAWAVALRSSDYVLPAVLITFGLGLLPVIVRGMIV